MENIFIYRNTHFPYPRDSHTIFIFHFLMENFLIFIFFFFKNKHNVGKFMILFFLYSPRLFVVCWFLCVLNMVKHNCEKLEGHKDKYRRKWNFHAWICLFLEWKTKTREKTRKFQEKMRYFKMWGGVVKSNKPQIFFF